MTWRQLQIIAIIVTLLSVYGLGFLYGRESGRKKALENAIIAFQKREKINDDISKLGDVDLCIALGGLPDECGSLMRGLDETTENK